MQKVLMINGSPRIGGNTSIALREMENIFKENDVEVETVQIGNKDIRISGYQDIRISGYQDIRGCIACHSCATKGKCVFDDV